MGFFRYLVIFGWLFIFKNRKCKIREVQSIRWELSTDVGLMAEGFQFKVFSVTIFRFFILGWSDSPEKYLPVFCPESQGLAASILEPKWLMIVESQLLECKYSLDPPVFTMVPVLLTMPECLQFRDCIILLKKKKEKENISSILLQRASLVAHLVKNPPAMQKTCVRFLGWEDPLAESIATHSSIHAWGIPMDRGAWRAIVHRITKSWTQLSD